MSTTLDLIKHLLDAKNITIFRNTKTDIHFRSVYPLDKIQPRHKSCLGTIKVSAETSILLFIVREENGQRWMER